ncbi:hypothetical protein RN001_012242 [Aquatica leii]|uniref:Uncharacterized protein n=1 Tax=Aquatica leii TaxID=1421715 RepID=A0AAN7SPE6_9COLE|nr:hypothetical protein RN001_012242 [Aquatica leii]
MTEKAHIIMLIAAILACHICITNCLITKDLVQCQYKCLKKIDSDDKQFCLMSCQARELTKKRKFIAI